MALEPLNSFWKLRHCLCYSKWIKMAWRSPLRESRPASSFPQKKKQTIHREVVLDWRQVILKLLSRWAWTSANFFQFRDLVLDSKVPNSRVPGAYINFQALSSRRKVLVFFWIDFKLELIFVSLQNRLTYFYFKIVCIHSKPPEFLVQLFQLVRKAPVAKISVLW